MVLETTTSRLEGGRSIQLSYAGGELLSGLEPEISCSEDRRLIHWAIGANLYVVRLMCVVYGMWYVVCGGMCALFGI